MDWLSMATMDLNIRCAYPSISEVDYNLRPQCDLPEENHKYNQYVQRQLPRMKEFLRVSKVSMQIYIE